MPLVTTMQADETNTMMLSAWNEHDEGQSIMLCVLVS